MLKGVSQIDGPFSHFNDTGFFFFDQHTFAIDKGDRRLFHAADHGEPFIFKS